MIDIIYNQQERLNNKDKLNDKLKQIIKLVCKLDDLEEYIENHELSSSFESIGKEFVESLHKYNSVLKDVCIDSLKDLYSK